MTRHIITLLVTCCAFLNFALAQKPTAHSSNLRVTEIRCDEVKLTWTKGNGARRVVFASINKPMSNPPYDGAGYYPHPKWGHGTSEGQAFCVYDGTGDSLHVFGLRPGKKFFFHIYEYNNNSTYQYLTAGKLALDSFTTNQAVAHFTLDSDIGQCIDGNTFTHTNMSIGPAGETLSYHWDIMNYYQGKHVTSDTSKNLVHSYKEGGEYTVKLKVRSSGGCQDSITRNEVVIIPYEADFMLDSSYHNPESTDICKQQLSTTIRLKNTSRNPNNAKYGPSDRVEMFWSSNVSSDIGRSFNHTLNTFIIGPVHVQLIMSRRIGLLGGCADTADRYFNINAPFESPENLHFEIINDTLSKNQFKFWHDSRNVESVLWKFGDGTTSTQDTVVHSYKKVGTFRGRIVGTDQIGCMDSIPFVVRVHADDITTSINTTSKTVIAVVPNPTNKSITLIGDIPNTPSYRIYDLTGKEYLNTVLNQTQKINVSTLPSGVYVLDLDGFRPTRFVKL